MIFSSCKSPNLFTLTLALSLLTGYLPPKQPISVAIEQLKKVLDKLPQFIKNIVESLFIYNNIQLKYFKQQYDPEEVAKQERFRSFTPKQKETLIYEKEYSHKDSKETDDLEL